MVAGSTLDFSGVGLHTRLEIPLRNLRRRCAVAYRGLHGAQLRFALRSNAVDLFFLPLALDAKGLFDLR